MEVILSVAFGLETNFQTKGDDTITKRLKDTTPFVRKNAVVGKPLFIYCWNNQKKSKESVNGVFKQIPLEKILRTLERASDTPLAKKLF